MWLSFLCIVGFLACIYVLDGFVLPKKNRSKRSHAYTLFSITPPIVFYVSILSLTYRPIISLVLCVVAYAVIVVLNNAKVKVVKEPLVYSDFHLFREIIRHPHLYVKYIGIRKLLGIVIIGLLCIYVATEYEKPFIVRSELADYMPAIMFFSVVIGIIYMITRGPLRKTFRNILLSFGPSMDVKENVSQLGLVVCLIFYFFLSGVDKVGKRPHALKKQKEGGVKVGMPGAWQKEGRLPNIVAVQAESFFDVRYLQSGLDEAILKNYDRIKDEAAFYGRLSVPAWGAYTMRTEFAFLSGLPEETLGHHRFNPYLQLGNKPFWTVAHSMRALGYRTICVHPFASSFFNRKKVFPNLGFDEFIDMNSFAKEDHYGPYVGDIAVGQKIIEVLQASKEPVFLFAITMENHGAWDEDRLKKFDQNSMDPENWPLGCYSLNHYISHMRHTDEMMADVVGYLEKQSFPGVFCLYGDHMPNLQNAFNSTGYEDPRTDYVIWRTKGKRNLEFDTSADILSRLMLDVAFNERKDTFSPAQRSVGDTTVKKY